VLDGDNSSCLSRHHVSPKRCSARRVHLYLDIYTCNSLESGRSQSSKSIGLALHKRDCCGFVTIHAAWVLHRLLYCEIYQFNRNPDQWVLLKVSNSLWMTASCDSYRCASWSKLRSKDVSVHSSLSFILSRYAEYDEHSELPWTVSSNKA
jgi:hypothetical protein